MRHRVWRGSEESADDDSRAVIVSLLLTGAFFVFVSYTEVLGFAGYKTTLDKIDAPLNVLSDMMHVGWLKAPISFGAMASFYSLALSCMNSGARILYPMGKLGVFHSSVGTSHETNETPHVAVTVMSILIFLSPVILTQVFKLEILDAFNDAGTFGAFGFLGAYFLISIAAPAYLSKRGELSPGAARALGSIGRIAAGPGGRQRLSGAVVAGEYLPVHLPGLSRDRNDLVHDSAPQSRLHR